jgi:hypothetical protein
MLTLSAPLMMGRRGAAVFGDTSRPWDGAGIGTHVLPMESPATHGATISYVYGGRGVVHRM